jgi:hypothetical protein
VNDWLPQFTRTFWVLPVVLYAISALEPSGLRHATFLTEPLSLDWIRRAPGFTNLVR